MKKRWFAIALTLCLTLELMTVTAEAMTHQAGCEYSSDSASFPATYTTLSATISSSDQSCDHTGHSTITVHSFQYPVDGNYHKLALTISIPEYKCWECNTTIEAFDHLTVTFNSGSDQYFCHSYNHEDAYGNKTMQLTSSVTTQNYGDIVFNLFAIPKRNNKNTGLTRVSKTDPTCTEGGISQDCWYCDVCDKYFSDAEGKNEIDTPVL